MRDFGAPVLANTRLAIMDLSERGSMPMCNEDSTVWITYNGECYNAAELRPQLVSRGHQFRSTTDTEVILHLYEESGDRCVEKLRGMFAFAITWHALLLLCPFTYGGLDPSQNFVSNAYFWLFVGVLFSLPEILANSPLSTADPRLARPSHGRFQF